MRQIKIGLDINQEGLILETLMEWDKKETLDALQPNKTQKAMLEADLKALTKLLTASATKSEIELEAVLRALNFLYRFLNLLESGNDGKPSIASIIGDLSGLIRAIKEQISNQAADAEKLFVEAKVTKEKELANNVISLFPQQQ